MYHRKDGRLVKEADDLLSATRYALMMLRYARTADEAGKRRVRVADDVDYDLFADKSAPAQPSGVVWGNGRPAHLEQKRNTNRNTDFDIF